MYKNETIILKSTISEEDYHLINELKNICIKHDNSSLKLELDYKLSNNHVDTHPINEFLYYDQNVLVGYLGICQFNTLVIEINGMVHPKFRRKGIFYQLYRLVLHEFNQRETKNMLLLCDRNSVSGQAFIKKTHAIYEHSEYEMVLSQDYTMVNKELVVLRKATNDDVQEILKQNEIYFNIPFNENDYFKIHEKEEQGLLYYLAMANEKIVGKVHIEFSQNSAVIYGLGVKPEYRNQGYGKAILNGAIHKIKEKNINHISLQVDAKNNRALNLYETSGFMVNSVMDYFKIAKQ